MSLLCEFRCNGPLCEAQAGRSAPTAPEGYLTLLKGEMTLHFCSDECLARYAVEMKELARA